MKRKVTFYEAFWLRDWARITEPDSAAQNNRESVREDIRRIFLGCREYLTLDEQQELCVWYMKFWRVWREAKEGAA